MAKGVSLIRTIGKRQLNNYKKKNFLDKVADEIVRRDLEKELDNSVMNSVRGNFNRGFFNEDEVRRDVNYMLKSGADVNDVLDLLNGKIDYVPLK